MNEAPSLDFVQKKDLLLKQAKAYRIMATIGLIAMFPWVNFMGWYLRDSIGGDYPYAAHMNLIMVSCLSPLVIVGIIGLALGKKVERQLQQYGEVKPE